MSKIKTYGLFYFKGCEDERDGGPSMPSNDGGHAIHRLVCIIRARTPDEAMEEIDAYEVNDLAFETKCSVNRLLAIAYALPPSPSGAGFNFLVLNCFNTLVDKIDQPGIHANMALLALPDVGVYVLAEIPEIRCRNRPKLERAE